MKTQEEKLREINKVLAALPRFDYDTTNNEIIKREKLGMPEFYSALKKLQVLGRIDPDNNRTVLVGTPLTMKEYKSIGDPYQKRRRAKIAKEKKRKELTPAKKGTVSKKVARKAVKKLKTAPGIYMKQGEGRTHETLDNPFELPIYEHKDGAEITISGTAAGVATFLKLLNK